MPTHTTQAATGFVLDAAAIDGLPWEPLPGLDVVHKVLWRSGDSMAGLMRLEPGQAIESHAHRRAHHHVWIVEGTCSIGGRPVAASTYAHVPAGEDHAIADVGADGCSFLYLYRQDPPA